MSTPQNPLLAAYRAQQAANQQSAPPSVIMPPDSSPSVAPLLPPEPGPRIVAPRGTIPADSAEQSRLLSSGSGISQIHSKIENSGFGQKHPFLGKLAGWAAQIPAMAADIGVSSVAPQITTLTPGTEYHHRALLNQGSRLLAQDYANQQKESQAKEENAQAGEAEAQTNNLENPPAQALPTSEGYYSFNPHTGEVKPISVNGEPLQPFIKPGNRQHVVLQGKDGQAILGFVDPTSGVTTDAQGNVIPNPVPFEKPGAEHPTAGTLDGKPAFGVFVQGKGWQDPNTGAPLPNFQPPPTFAQTGLWQPTEGVDPKTGQLVPGMLNERTGEFRTTAASPKAAPAALPKDVTSELGKELQTAREADKRLRIMENNEQAALKGDQQAMVSLVANHIGMTLGAQKGARINQAVWNEAIESAPWLQRATARFGKDGLLSGVTLSPDQIRQMVELGQVVRDNQWQQVDQAFSQYGIPTGAGGAAEHGGSQSGGETRQYQGHTYTKGADGQWHLQQK